MIAGIRSALRHNRILVLTFVWAFAEATVFFIVPDILIGFAALSNMRRGLRAVVVATVGATLGGLTTYLLAPQIGALLPHIPGISPAMIADAHARLVASGWPTIITAAVEGIPYKVFAIEAARIDMPLPLLLLVTPLARAWRFLLAAFVAGCIGIVLRPHIRAHPRFFLLMGVTVWVHEYVVYFRDLHERYGG